MTNWEIKVNTALQEVAKIVEDKGVLNDITYFNFHRNRYHRMAMALAATFNEGRKSVLNIGSHYLHTTLLFQFLGFEVDSMEVNEFWDIDFVAERTFNYPVNKITENDLETLNSLTGIENRYNIILFTEILEHITFNPIHFWKRIYDVMKPGGIIYISTPNSLSLINIIRSMVRMLSLRGIGIPLNQIFTHVTYGHHWKEYSASEIVRYFNQLADDFTVKINKYHYKEKQPNQSFFNFISLIGNKSGYFADEIEAIISTDKKGRWLLEKPAY